MTITLASIVNNDHCNGYEHSNAKYDQIHDHGDDADIHYDHEHDSDHD